MSVSGRSPRKRSAQILCGALAGPLFVAAFTAIGAVRRGYDWRRYPVSSLAIGRQGWHQRTNFIVAGVLYSCAATGLARSDRRRIGPRAVPVLIAGVGIGLIGSGLFVTDYVGDLPGEGPDEKNRGPFGAAPPPPTRAGQLHNLCGIPVFAGIPIAALASAITAARSQGLPLGLLFGRIKHGDGGQFASLRLRDQRSVPPPRQKWDPAAYVDRHRIRMAELVVASRPVCMTNPHRRLCPRRIKGPIDETPHLQRSSLGERAPANQ